MGDTSTNATTQEGTTATTTTTGAATRGCYTGPSAARIADLIAPQQRVRFERGWFWTAAVCHDSDQDTLAFRQRPDGDGIDVRCKSAGCSRVQIIRRLEALSGASIWSAYGADADRSDPPQEAKPKTGATRQRDWRIILLPFALMLLAAPLVMGCDAQVVLLNGSGLGWAAWLVRRVVLNRRAALAKASRRR